MLAPWFCFGSCSNNELRLSCFHSIESLDLFEEFLSQRGPWVGGFDLPFSMPRDLIEHFDWPSRWDIFTKFYCSLDKKVIKKFLLSGVVQKIMEKNLHTGALIKHPNQVQL